LQFEVKHFLMVFDSGESVLFTNSPVLRHSGVFHSNLTTTYSFGVWLAMVSVIFQEPQVFQETGCLICRTLEVVTSRSGNGLITPYPVVFIISIKTLLSNLPKKSIVQ